MLDKLFRAHSEKNGLGEKNGGAAMNGTASTKENPGVRRELSERPTPDIWTRPIRCGSRTLVWLLLEEGVGTPRTPGG